MPVPVPTVVVTEIVALFFAALLSLSWSLSARNRGLHLSSVSILMSLVAGALTTAFVGAFFPALPQSTIRIMLLLNMFVAATVAVALFRREWRRVHQLRSHASEIVEFLLDHCLTAEETAFVTRVDLVVLRDSSEYSHMFALIELILENMDTLGHRAPAGVFVDEALLSSGDFWSRLRRFVFESSHYFIIAPSDMRAIRERIERL